MITTDNSLRAEIILLATKALDLLNHALDLLSADVVGRSALPLGSSKNASERCSSGSVVGNASERYSTATNQSTDCHAQKRDPLPCSATTDQSTDCHAQRRDPLLCSATTDQSTDCHARRRDPLPDTYRADAIRFNEQYLRENYELRYNTMLKTTKFRPKSAAQLGARSPSTAPGSAVVSPLGARSSSPAPGSAVVSPALETSQAENKDTPTAVLRAGTSPLHNTNGLTRLARTSSPCETM